MTYGYCTVKERVNTQLLLDPGKTSGLVSYAMGVHSTMHEHEPFFYFLFGTGTGKVLLRFCGTGTRTGKPKHLSFSLGRERENPNVIPVVLDGNRKYNSQD